MRHYWFKPKRWGWVAVYVPTSFPGYVATMSCFFFLLYFFILSAEISNSWSDTLILFTPWAIAVFLVYDLLCFRTGQYPHWWEKPKR